MSGIDRRCGAHALLVVFLLSVVSCSQGPSTTGPVAAIVPADSIYYGGDILTMAGDSPQYAEALAVTGGKITLVGTKAEADKLKGPATVVNDLQGKTLLPGMIDTHLHWGQFVMLSALDRVNPVEVGNVDSYIQHLKDVAAKTPEGDWVIGYGYEKLLIKPYRNLTRQDLDRVSTKHPVIALYNNLHWATANSAALKKLGIDKKSPTNMAGGGVIFKDKAGEPTGLLTESALFVIGPVAASLLSPEKQASLPYDIANQLSANGLTTVADMSSGSSGGADEILAMQKLVNDDRFPLRFSAAVMYDVLPKFPHPIPWDGKFQASSCKLLLDASLAGGTAATLKPQLNGSTGNLNYTPDAYKKAIADCMDRGFSVSTHVMGDRAHKVLLQAFEELKPNYDYSKFHNTIEHSAIIDPSDLPRVKNLNFAVGFLSPFIDVYGDPLRDIVLGDEMASRLFAMPLYDKIGIDTSLHSDGPIVESRPMYLVWSAVNRTTSSGKVLGPELKEPVYGALLGVTRNSARQLGLGAELGSLGVGNNADLAVLSENPLKVDPTKIRDIQVLETIKGGKTYFKK